MRTTENALDEFLVLSYKGELANAFVYVKSRLEWNHSQEQESRRLPERSPGWRS